MSNSSLRLWWIMLLHIFRCKLDMFSFLFVKFLWVEWLVPKISVCFTKFQKCVYQFTIIVWEFQFLHILINTSYLAIRFKKWNAFIISMVQNNSPLIFNFFFFLQESNSEFCFLAQYVQDILVNINRHQLKRKSNCWKIPQRT